MHRLLFASINKLTLEYASGTQVHLNWPCSVEARGLPVTTFEASEGFARESARRLWISNRRVFLCRIHRSFPLVFHEKCSLFQHFK